MAKRASSNKHRDRIVEEAEKLAMSGLSILALYLPGEQMSGGREATGKEPREAGWSKKPEGEERATEVLAQLRRRDSNLGVRLGAPSRGLVDVDMDCSETEELGRVWLPETGMVFGRDSCPESHRLYSWAESWTGVGGPELKTKKFQDGKTMLIEIRSTGGQTAFPGTRHKSGEVVEWVDDGVPGTTEGLERAVGKVAAGALIARNWGQGSFHDGTLALAGGLIRAGWEREEVEDFVCRVGELAGMTNLEDRRRAVGDTWTKFKDGENVCGWPTAAGIFGDEVIGKVRSWLMIGVDEQVRLGELELHQQVPWSEFPDPKTKMVDGEPVVVGLKGTIENVETMVKAYGIELRYEVIRRKLEARFRGEAWKQIDNQFDAQIESLAARNGVPLMRVTSAINALAIQNRINPVLAWIESLEWDKKDHIQEATRLVEVEAEEKKWRDKFIRLWLIQCVAALDHARRTPRRDALAKFESVLVMRGEQGGGKTKWVTQLVPAHLRPWVKTSLHVNPADRDSLDKVTTCWIGEIGELDATFRRSDISQLKAFLSQDTDEYRVPYGHRSETYPRCTSYTATVNEINFLQDPSGNRRFWVINAFHAGIYGNVDQLWAQAWQAYLDGEAWWLSQEEDRAMREHQRAYAAAELDPTYEALHTAFGELGEAVEKSEWLSIQEIAERAGLVYGLERVDQKVARKIAQYMREYSRDECGRVPERRPKNKIRFAVPKKGRIEG